MITEEELDSLVDFGKEEDGSYCDRWEFSIFKNGRGEMALWFFNEVNGDTTHIKALKDFDDLKQLYRALTDRDLEIKVKDLKVVKSFTNQEIEIIIDFKVRRKRAALTLREVEIKTGISNAYLSQLESGKISKPSFDTVVKLHNLYCEYEQKN